MIDSNPNNLQFLEQHATPAGKKPRVSALVRGSKFPIWTKNHPEHAELFRCCIQSTLACIREYFVDKINTASLLCSRKRLCDGGIEPLWVSEATSLAPRNPRHSDDQKEFVQEGFVSPGQRQPEAPHICCQYWLQRLLLRRPKRCGQLAALFAGGIDPTILPIALDRSIYGRADAPGA